MMTRRSKRQSGNALIEFTLAGIPLMFVLISTFDMARGMWMYHTLAHSIKEGARLAVVHGNGCRENPNQCQISVGDIARRIEQTGVGLLPNELQVTMASSTRTITGTLQTLRTNAECFPVSAGCACTVTVPPAVAPSPVPPVCNAPIDPGAEWGEDITITATYPFRSFITFFSVQFGTYNLPASSRQRIEY
jgi:Flp pilus assembly protein TadG